LRDFGPSQSCSDRPGGALLGLARTVPLGGEGNFHRERLRRRRRARRKTAKCYETDRITFVRAYLTQLQRVTDGVPVKGLFLLEHDGQPRVDCRIRHLLWDRVRGFQDAEADAENECRVVPRDGSAQGGGVASGTGWRGRAPWRSARARDVSVH
jgi:hypothetical protein